MISIAIIGTGNVGFHLYQEFNQKSEFKTQQFNSREQQDFSSFDLAIIAVSDDAIAEVSRNVQSPFVVHTSGTVAMDVMQNKTRKGVLYPLQSFSKDKEVDFTQVPFCLEAENDQDLTLLKKIVSMLGSKHYVLSSEQRKYLHVAAVFANNFTNHMYQQAYDICQEHQVPFDILLPLIEETAQKIKRLSPNNAQTGPAKRNDQETIKNHLHLLTSSQKELYQTLTDSIQSHGKKL
jgi:predicted short-subunit dehydrogenase-like oxidoreductase (DUF2520 family)